MRPGGLARFGEAAIDSARAAADIVGRSGLGDLTKGEFDRYLASLRLAVGSSIRADREQLSATGPVTEWPHLARLLRTQMMAPRCSTSALQDYVFEMRDRLDSASDGLVDERFDQAFEKGLGMQRQPDVEKLSALDIGGICSAYRTAFADTAGMTIVVEGNLSPEDAYAGVASALDIPASEGDAKRSVRPVTDLLPGRTLVYSGSRPLARVRLAMRPAGNARAGEIAAQILALRLFERLREGEKGTYDVFTGLNPKAKLFTVEFDCAIENVDRLIAATKDEMDRLRISGPTDAEIVSARRGVGEQKLNAEAIAESWIAGRPLVTAEPTDAEVRAWGSAELIGARLHEFVRLPVQPIK
jgi:zinc protease